MNNVCDRHKNLVSTTRKENHHELSKNVMEIIEEAKTRNLNQVDEAISTVRRAKHKRDLLLSKQHVQTHNDNITEEWNELVAEIHAFDSHIHEQIVAENKNKTPAPPEPEE